MRNVNLETDGRLEYERWLVYWGCVSGSEHMIS